MSSQATHTDTVPDSQPRLQARYVSFLLQIGLSRGWGSFSSVRFVERLEWRTTREPTGHALDAVARGRLRAGGSSQTYLIRGTAITTHARTESAPDDVRERVDRERCTVRCRP